jgi:pyruvate dehydrogenase E2 component (dihydrolipoamide acetyltransferase)
MVPAPAAPAPDETQPAEADTGGGIAAGPAVRRFAREVGVDLARVQGTGASGRITRDDVLSVVRQANEVARSRGISAAPGGTPEPTESDQWGPVRYEKLPKIRKTIAAKMSESWSTAPRVTNFDDADVTELERIRQSSKDDYAANGIKLTSLPFIIKSVAMSLKKNPVVNASIDLENERTIYKNYVNIGIAVDTERGLVVPSLRDVDKLSISEIARQMANLAEKVRTGNFAVDELRGSTFTISNLGAIGGTYSTPMINVPEVAILLVGRSRKMPVVINEQIVARLMLPLSLSYDHRLVDGAAAARFLNDVIGFLESPSRLLMAP